VSERKKGALARTQKTENDNDLGGGANEMAYQVQYPETTFSMRRSVAWI
jgi:hypothetical protein